MRLLATLYVNYVKSGVVGDVPIKKMYLVRRYKVINNA